MHVYPHLKILHKTWPNFNHLVLSPNLAYPLKTWKIGQPLFYLLYVINQNVSYFTTSPRNFVIFKGKKISFPFLYPCKMVEKVTTCHKT